MDEVELRFDWLFKQSYKRGENEVTEALMKWFCYSTASVQRRFSRQICRLKRVPIKQITWDELALQARGKHGVPDATVELGGRYFLLIESKIADRKVSRKQLRRHLRRYIADAEHTEVRELVITPDWKRPRKIDEMPGRYRRLIVWCSWQELHHFIKKCTSTAVLIASSGRHAWTSFGITLASENISGKLYG